MAAAAIAQYFGVINILSGKGAAKNDFTSLAGDVQGSGDGSHYHSSGGHPFSPCSGQSCSVVFAYILHLCSAAQLKHYGDRSSLQLVLVKARFTCSQRAAWCVQFVAELCSSLRRSTVIWSE